MDSSALSFSSTLLLARLFGLEHMTAGRVMGIALALAGATAMAVALPTTDARCHQNGGMYSRAPGSSWGWSRP